MTAHRLESLIGALPFAYRGPGGAVAVVRGGETLVRHTWGWANAERRIPFTPRSLFRMCSITKQFTCGVVLRAFGDPSVLDGDVRARLPHLGAGAPDALQLCHNQSGLGDYWAVAMLHGAPAESAFGDADAQRVIAGTRSLQFTPGTRYSYTNQNFRILSDIAQARSGKDFASLLRTHMFAPAGMESAFLAAETAAMPDGTTGYEGTQETGFRAAENNILWTGDGGLGASLDDMIAWERHIDATRDDPGAIYNRLCAPVQFADGAPAFYGFGLARRPEFGRAVTGHGGALRGWRSHRLHVAAERLSVVVMFNHMADAQAAAMDVLAAVLDEARPARAAHPAPSWLGAYLSPETGLLARIDAASDGRIRLRYGHSAEKLDMLDDGSAASDTTMLVPRLEGLHMRRVAENQFGMLVPCAAGGTADVAGQYRCAELSAELTLSDAGGVLYGGFSGFLGQGRMEMLEPVARDVWALPCPRALDHTPPGDWTVHVHRDARGAPGHVMLGCWLARGLRYDRV